MWIMPSMPSPRSTKPPNLARLVTGAFHHRAHRILLQRLFPGIAQRLLQAQRDARSAGVHAQHHHFHHFARLDHVARLRTFFVQDISETWISPSTPGSSSTNAPKSATRETLPCTRSPDLEFLAGQRPRIGRSCFSPSEISRVCRIDLENLDLDLLARRHHVGRLHAARQPCRRRAAGRRRRPDRRTRRNR